MSAPQRREQGVSCHIVAVSDIRPNEELIVEVKTNGAIEQNVYLDQFVTEIVGIEVGAGNGYVCRGDGTDTAIVHIRNNTEAGIRIEPGTRLATCQVVEGAREATADGMTFEITEIAAASAAGAAVEKTAKQLYEQKEHKFFKLKWLPIRVIPVVVYFSGIGGFDMGIKRAWELYGTAFRVALAIDYDEKQVVNGIYEKTFPSVMVVKHKLGVSFKRTLDLVAKYVPRDTWWLTYWHASPSCLEGSSANFNKQNFREFIRNTKWILQLFQQAKPGRWTMEQIARAARYVTRLTPYARVVNMRLYNAQTSNRSRLIASKRNLQHLEPLTAKEYNSKFKSPKQLILEAYDERDNDELILKNGFNYVRDAEEPAFTVTSNALRYGTEDQDMKVIKSRELLKMMDIDIDEWELPEEIMSNQSKLLRIGCQCVMGCMARLWAAWGPCVNFFGGWAPP